METGLQDTDIEVSIFRSFLDREAFCPARMICCGAGEIEFLSEKRFDEGSPVYIRVTRCGNIDGHGKPPEGFRSAALAKVVRCRPAGSESDALFETRAAYF